MLRDSSTSQRHGDKFKLYHYPPPDEMASSPIHVI
jgi:hypothetical protein